MRFHVLGQAHTKTNRSFNCNAFTQADINICKMLKDNEHEVFHYGVEGSKLECTEHIDVVSESEFSDTYGNIDHTQPYEKNVDVANDYAWDIFRIRSAHEIRKRAEEGDFVLATYGTPHQPISVRLDDLPIHVVEPCVMYDKTFSKYRVFQSYSKMHYERGRWNERFENYLKLSEEQRQQVPFDSNTMMSYTSPEWADAVIPQGFNLDDFEYRAEKDDYFMYVGRLVRNKGIEHAIWVAEKLGKQLVIAGQGDFEEAMGFKPPHFVKLLGPLSIEERAKWMAGAILGFCISYYIEPLCFTAIEFQLSGTPVITADQGGFVDTVLPGITGYRVRVGAFEKALWAAKNIGNIDPKVCREWAVNNFSLERVGYQYNEYFSDLKTRLDNTETVIDSNGVFSDRTNEWYTNQKRKNLDWLAPQFPKGVLNG